MRFTVIVLSLVLAISFLFTGCTKKHPKENFDRFNAKFFEKHIPEFPKSRLLTKHDIPEDQQEYFESVGANLQLLLDLNQNNTPEYVVCGVSDSLLKSQQGSAYFIAIFEQTETGIKRQHLQKLAVAPVNIYSSNDKNRPGVVLSFAFSSEFAAEIYYENNSYKLERW